MDVHQFELLKREHERLCDACCDLLRALDVDDVSVTDAIKHMAEQAGKESPNEPVIGRLFVAARKAGLR